MSSYLSSNGEVVRKILFTAVSDNMRPVISKTSLDFGFFCDINQNLKARCFLMDLLGNRNKFTSGGSKDHGLRFVDVETFCVVCREDLCYDVLLCDVKLSRFSF